MENAEHFPSDCRAFGEGSVKTEHELEYEGLQSGNVLRMFRWLTAGTFFGEVA